MQAFVTGIAIGSGFYVSQHIINFLSNLFIKVVG
jgi:hypothetical protein